MLRFAPSELSAAELALQSEVREFLADELPRGSFAPGLGMASGRDQDFSRSLAARGWLGMALPRRYGGAERGVVDRFIVVEELLRWGAPVRLSLGRRPADGPADPALRQRRSARALPARDLPRRGVVLDRHERAAGGQRPRRRADAREAHATAAGA